MHNLANGNSHDDSTKLNVILFSTLKNNFC